MSEPLIWRDDWQLKIDLLDDEHREMVRLINCLFDEAATNPLIERLDALIDHLRQHFHAEEAFLREIDYPDVESHCREHSMQMAEFVDLQRSIRRSQVAVLNAVDRQSIRHWFFNHVISQDQRFGQFYRDVVCGYQETD
ncbi:MAG: hemerythrin family protein [Thiohalocapsa sp. PB-PSB1]|jgi:hemerythrin|nr:MAG: hypothetical protein N838_32855 [Thiohalocapsa sp. PB-PSB1]QQO52614.1 MAG: hemerythrin family protein [Thiohalocapsa sp. PB-PSB1]HCS91783.1 hypothetical protein [Chromatiaceae bacterium]